MIYWFDIRRLSVYDHLKIRAKKIDVVGQRTFLTSVDNPQMSIDICKQKHTERQISSQIYRKVTLY